MKGGENLKDRVSVKPKILSLNDTNDIYMLMNIAILSNEVNYNNLRFTDDFIEGVIENKDSYTGIPFLANKNKLENGDYDSLTHELNKTTGKLETDQIGSFVDFWEEELDGANCLMGSVKIFKRFPETCMAIVDLYNEGELETSCEVLVSEYANTSQGSVKDVHYNKGKNQLIGSAIVTEGAERRAKPTLLVAEAYEKDLATNFEGGDNLGKKEIYNNGIKVKYHKGTELASLTYYDIESEVYNKLNPVDVENGERSFYYYIYEIYNDKVIVMDEKDGDLYSVGYEVDRKTVILDSEEDWVKGSYQFVPDEVDLESLIESREEKVVELNKELNKVKGELEVMSKNKELELNEKEEEMQATIDELTKEKEALEERIEELEATIVSEKEEKTELEATIVDLEEQVEDLAVYKDKFETAEKESKIAELNAKYSKLVSEETFASEEMVQAIQELDESKLNAIVVSEIDAEKKKASVSVGSEGTISVNAVKQKDLIPKDILQKYLG